MRGGRGKRACESCRQLKAKCDFERPSCDRCTKRGVVCSFSIASNERNLVFRDQNAFARQKATGGKRQLLPTAGSSAEERLEEDTSTNDVIPHWWSFPWLSDAALTTLPESIRRSTEARAVDRFFMDWCLHPSNHGISPGYMDDLPELYFDAPSSSLIKLAVQSMAFAALKETRNEDDVTFARLARGRYGTALLQLQELASDTGYVSDDSTVAAFLLIDAFEMMYTARAGPLGPHGQIITYSFHSKADDTVYSSRSYGVWRVMHHRLQMYQIFTRQEPELQQVTWVDKLRSDRPDLHITADILQMSLLRAKVNHLISKAHDEVSQRIAEASQLLQSTTELIATIENWTSTLKSHWRPVRVQERPLSQSGKASRGTLPITEPYTLTYHDAWLTYMFNFHSASQIILRDSLIDTITYLARLQQRAISVSETGRIELEKQVAHILTKNILESIPPLLGFDGTESNTDAFAMHAGATSSRLFALLSLWAVQEAKLTDGEHKKTAADVVKWIKSNYCLD